MLCPELSHQFGEPKTEDVVRLVSRARNVLLRTLQVSHYSGNSIRRHTNVCLHLCAPNRTAQTRLSTSSCLVCWESDSRVKRPGAREPGGQGRQMTPGNLHGGSNMVFWPPRFLWKIFSCTHPHGIYVVIILYSETRSRTVFFCYYL